MKTKICKNCGKEFKCRSNNAKWCDDCSTINCEQCGKEIRIYPSRKGRSRFCTKECHSIYTKENELLKGEKNPAYSKVVVKCRLCKEEMLLAKCRAEKRIFCSRECQFRWYKGEGNPSYKNKTRIINCHYCGKQVKRYESQMKGINNHFCSGICHSKYSQTITGEDHFNWGGGNNKHRGDFYKVKKENFNKIQFCAICGTTKKIHIHHIIPYRYTKDNSISNLIPLCNSCHRKTEATTRNIMDVSGGNNTEVVKMILNNILRARQLETLVVLREVLQNESA